MLRKSSVLVCGRASWRTWESRDRNEGFPPSLVVRREKKWNIFSQIM